MANRLKSLVIGEFGKGLADVNAVISCYRLPLLMRFA